MPVQQAQTALLLVVGFLLILSPLLCWMELGRLNKHTKQVLFELKTLNATIRNRNQRQQ